MFNRYRNLSVYALNRDVPFSREELQKQLEACQFTPCGSQDMAKTGFVTPWDASHSDNLVMEYKGYIMLAICKQVKLLPSHVLKEALLAKIEKLENEQSRKLKKTEKDALKDEVLHSLLPRAFTRNTTSWMVIDTNNNRIYTSTVGKAAEDALALLRKALGSLPVVPLTLETPAELTMTEWVRSGEVPAGFALKDGAQLKAILEDGGIINCKKQDLVTDEIATHIAAGKVVTAIDLDWQERIQFTIKDTAVISKLKFSDTLQEQNDDIDREDVLQRMEADFILMMGELVSLVDNVIQALGGEAKR